MNDLSGAFYEIIPFAKARTLEGIAQALDDVAAGSWGTLLAVGPFRYANVYSRAVTMAMDYVAEYAKPDGIGPDVAVGQKAVEFQHLDFRSRRPWPAKIDPSAPLATYRVIRRDFADGTTCHYLEIGGAPVARLGLNSCAEQLINGPDNNLRFRGWLLWNIFHQAADVLGAKHRHPARRLMHACMHKAAARA